jgi:hypothetical protein
VLEAGGRADLPLRELLLQAAARDLAQRLHARNPRSTESDPHGRGRQKDQSNRPRARMDRGERGGGLGFLTFREADEEEVELVMAGRRAAAGFPRRRKGGRQQGRGGGEERYLSVRGGAAAYRWAAAPKGKPKGRQRIDRGRGDWPVGRPLLCIFHFQVI